MSVESRTGKALKNSVVALIMFALNLVLKFFSRKVFLDYLGTEILGLNTTATNLLQFLNLAELGIGSAIAFALYKPLFEKSHDEVNEIMAVLGWLYKRIALFVMGGAIIIMCFFPLIFKKIELPLWYAFSSFAVLLFSALLGYFVNYKQMLLSADQKDYKLQLAFQLTMIIKVLCQILAVRYLSHGYEWWLVLEVVFAIIASVAINKTVAKTYPYLRTVKVSGTLIKEKYSILVKKIKQLFFHKIGAYVLTQTSPLIIYAYTTLSVVALYGNYQLVINGFSSMLNAVFNSMAAGVGNLIAEGDKHHIMKIFRELFSIRFLIIYSLCLVIYIITPQFITLWIGPQYVLDTTTLVLMIAIFYIQASRLTVDAFVNGFGLYGDIWAPIAEAAINIGMSVYLGALYGLNGVICGVLISLVFSMIIWKPIYLFFCRMKGYYLNYVWDYIRHLAAAALATVAILWLQAKFDISGCANLLELALYALVLGFATLAVLAVLQLAFGCGLRFFIQRLLKKL